MKKALYFLVLLAALLYSFIQEQGIPIPGLQSPEQSNHYAVQGAYDNRQSDIQVMGEGVVIKVLADDNEGSRHQKFILRTSGRMTLLVSHNIDLAPRIPRLRAGDTVDFYGEYEWNEKGGVLHWTHHDPGGRHIDGWLKHNGKTYQ